MEVYEAMNIIESGEPPTDEQMTEAYQCLIDTGVVWELQDLYARAAEALIENGICHKASIVPPRKDPDYGRHNTIDWMIR